MAKEVVEEDTEMAGNVKCPECGSTHVWKTGTVLTRKGRKARLKCQECARSFYAPEPKAKKSKAKRKAE